MHVLIFLTVYVTEVWWEEMVCSDCWLCIVSQFLLDLRWIANVLCKTHKLYELDRLQYHNTRFTTNLCGRTCWLGVDWLSTMEARPYVAYLYDHWPIFISTSFVHLSLPLSWQTNSLFPLIVPISTPKGTDIHPISTPIKPPDFWCDVVTFFIFVTTVRVSLETPIYQGISIFSRKNKLISLVKIKNPLEKWGYQTSLKLDFLYEKLPC